MPSQTSPGGIVFPTPSDPVAPLNAVFQDLAESAQSAIGRADLATSAYRYVTTIYYTSNGTFDKGNYPWLRAIRVKLVGGGGGGGGSNTTPNRNGGGGGGGCYAESFITNIAGLASSVTVTRGAGGAGGTETGAGSSGGSSSFGAFVVGFGGGFGRVGNVDNIYSGASSGAGDLVIPGSSGGASTSIDSPVSVGNGGHSALGFGGPVARPNAGFNVEPILAGTLFGGGGSGGHNTLNSRPGAPGANGIVIVELYA